MQDLGKITSQQLYTFWKNLSFGLLTVVAVLVLSVLLPFYFSTIIALFASAYLYTVLYNNKLKRNPSCMIIPYAIFICLITFSFVSIVINILNIWNILWIPPELNFFQYPYIPSLLLCPICFIVMVIIHFREGKLNMCISCKLKNGDPTERGKIGALMAHESELQIRNLMIIFGVITTIIWTYYLKFYINTDVNNRDWYVFMWLTIIVFVLDEVYFIARYFNLYLDMKENNEIITQEELRDMTSATYIRYYVVCDDYVFISNKVTDPRAPLKPMIDTPFFTKRSVNGITIPEVTNIIRRMTGVRDGDLRFFFGRKIIGGRHSLLRYFYYLDGKPEDYPELNAEGSWMSFDELKRIYSFTPDKLAKIYVSDITRLATIMLTYKIFDDKGFRKNKLKSYRPTFSLKEVRNSNLDFQDDKWIKISLFNSDTPFYRVKKWMKGIFGSGANKKSQQWN